MRNLAFALLLFWLSACQTLSNGNDNEYAKRLVGTWAAEYDEDDGVTISGEKTYRSDGTAHGFTVYKVRTQSGELQTIKRVDFTSNWKISDGVVLITDVAYSDGTSSAPIHDQIISIGAKKAVFRDLTDGSEFERTRLK